MTDDELEDVLGGLFPDVDPEDVEDLMRGLRKFGQQMAPVARTVAPLAQRALPGMLQGAMQGGMVAGPWGAVAGALGGGAMSLMSSPKPGAAGGPPGAVVVPVAAPTQGTLAPPRAAAPSNAAIQQLIALLARPEVIQALQSLLLGGAGRSTVAVGGRQVPVTMFANTIAELASEAVEEASFYAAADVEEFLVEADGRERCDVGNPVEHTALLIADLAAIERREIRDDEYAAAAGEDYDDDFYDSEEEFFA